VSGKSNEEALGTTAAENTGATDEGDDCAALSRSDAAQQLSAWVCVTACAAADPSELELCIGHAVSAQQAIRASGVGIQPAQTAPFAVARARTSPRAGRQRLIFSTLLVYARIGDTRWARFVEQRAVA
jgi:hypothetical protein